MPSGAGYPIEEFLEAITAQLDQTQDALRLKAVNRPLTFALKDFNVDLKVFVEMDTAGRVTFRPAAPNEEGASTVSIGFTTITRPMIEENTISMEMAQAPTLEELGLEREEQRKLAKIGVRNAAQLRNLERNAGDTTLSRHTGVDLRRIKGALDLARPRLDDDPIMGSVAPGPADPVQPEPVQPEPVWPEPVRPEPAVEPQPVVPPEQDPKPGPLPWRGPIHEAPRVDPGPTVRPGPVPPKRLRLQPGERNIRLKGRNLIENGRTPIARLDGRPLPALQADAFSVAFGLPDGDTTGRLEIELPDGTVNEYDLIRDDGGQT
jgi:hypothetical protein